MNKIKGFTLLEIIITIAIIGILASIVFFSNGRIRERTYQKRTDVELKTFAYALKMYAFEHNGVFPPDANRSLPSGLEAYLSTSPDWPDAPWPGSVYDWDNWTIDGEPEPIYQISARFCPMGGPLSECHFPNEIWAEGFNIDSAYYYCISGSCRSHASQPITYPGYCSNCATQPSGS